MKSLFSKGKLRKLSIVSQIIVMLRIFKILLFFLYVLYMSLDETVVELSI